jgi:hypothetical protein
MLVDLFQAKVILPLMKIWFGHKRGDAAPERAAHFAQGWHFFMLGFKYTAGLQFWIRSDPELCWPDPAFFKPDPDPFRLEICQENVVFLP